MAIKEKLQGYFDGFCEFMQKDTKGVEIGVYAASGILFAVAYYKIRPITKFGKASDIPNHFIRDKIRQFGKIEAVDPSSTSGPLLLINHKPPLNFLIPSRKLLPVKLTGITVNANGYSWLQTVSVDHKIEFIPLVKNSDNAECQVMMICPNNKKVKLDLSEALLSLGFGKLTTSSKSFSEPVLKRYYQYLELIEKDAKNQRSGLWSNSLPPIPWPVKTFKKTCKSIILSLLPADRRLPELVR